MPGATTITVFDTLDMPVKSHTVPVNIPGVATGIVSKMTGGILDAAALGGSQAQPLLAPRRDLDSPMVNYSNQWVHSEGGVTITAIQWEYSSHNYTLFLDQDDAIVGELFHYKSGSSVSSAIYYSYPSDPNISGFIEISMSAGQVDSSQGASTPPEADWNYSTEMTLNAWKPSWWGSECGDAWVHLAASAVETGFWLWVANAAPNTYTVRRALLNGFHMGGAIGGVINYC